MSRATIRGCDIHQSCAGSLGPEEERRVACPRLRGLGSASKRACSRAVRWTLRHLSRLPPKEGLPWGIQSSYFSEFRASAIPTAGEAKRLALKTRQKASVCLVDEPSWFQRCSNVLVRSVTNSGQGVQCSSPRIFSNYFMLPLTRDYNF